MGLVILGNDIKRYMTRKVSAKCRYCCFLSKKRQDKSQPWNTILYESHNFVVVPTLGSLVEGWLLILSKEHYLCMGAVPDILRGELEDVVDFTSDVITRAYHSPTIFEHGPSEEGTDVGCGIDHAHLHLMPLQFSLVEQVKKNEELSGLTWSKCEGDLCQLQNLYRQRKPYLYIKDPGRESVYSIPERVSCQCLRRVVAHKLGIENEYDYNKFHFAINAERTINSLREDFLKIV